MIGMARSVSWLLPLSVLFGSTLQAVHAGEPHRPPTRGTIFIPIGDQKKEAPAATEAPQMTPFEAAGPAESALADIPDAPALAEALRALVNLDAEKVRMAPDMASAVGAHLPRYRLQRASVLRARPSADADPLMEAEAGLTVILVAVDGSWQQIYLPSRHVLGWRSRSPEAP